MFSGKNSRKDIGGFNLDMVQLRLKRLTIHRSGNLIQKTKSGKIGFKSTDRKHNESFEKLCTFQSKSNKSNREKRNKKSHNTSRSNKEALGSDSF